jgi:hypothetical protein
MENPENKSDHDLLVEVSTILKRVVQDIRELKDGTSSKISRLEREVEDLRNWKSSVGTYLWIYGIVGGFIATLLIYHMTK